MSKCVNCTREAAIVWAAPGADEVLYCTKCRPSFTYKAEYARYAGPVPVAEVPAEEPAPKPSKKIAKEEEAPSEAPAEETTAPEEEPTP